MHASRTSCRRVPGQRMAALLGHCVNMPSRDTATLGSYIIEERGAGDVSRQYYTGPRRRSVSLQCHIIQSFLNL